MLQDEDQYLTKTKLCPWKLLVNLKLIHTLNAHDGLNVVVERVQPVKKRWCQNADPCPVVLMLSAKLELSVVLNLCQRKQAGLQHYPG